MNRRNFVRAFAASPLLLSTSLPGRAAVGKPAAGIARLSGDFMARLPRLMEIASLPGLGIGLVQDGRLAWEHYAGVADTGTNARVSATTLFPAASLGKPVFASAVLQLGDEGRIDLDRPLFDYLPEERPAGDRERRITTRHVLSHSSGFSNWRQDAAEPFASRFEPGTKFRYSGEGYYLLQRCVERITKTGTEAFMQERMGRWGMKTSTYLWRADAMERLAQGHSFFRDNEPPSRSYWDFNARVFELMQKSGKPAADWRHEQTLDAAKQMRRDLTAQSMRPNVASGLFTTVQDYAAFLGRLARPPGDAADLRPATYAEMLNGRIRVNSMQRWGLGFGLESSVPEAQPEYLWQWGDNGGGIWKNFTLVHPASGSAIVAFSNGTYGMRVIQRIVNEATGRDLAAFVWVG
ncbi:MAG: serine hydrolase domain-containing protein [Opitutaceae bacterium]